MSPTIINTATSRRFQDQIGNGDVTRVSTAAFAVADALQKQEGLLPGEAIAAVTAAFIITLEASRLPSAAALGNTRNLMADANGRRPEFKAFKDYMEKEILSV